MAGNRQLIRFSMMLMLAVLPVTPAGAHCDSMDGPVVQDAQKALAGKNVMPVLKWVPEKDEEAVRKAFEMTLAVRGESAVAKELSERYFFETLIRLHRASEGEAFAGLKPAGSVDPMIAAADRALADGNIQPLSGKLTAAVTESLKERFTEARAKRAVAEKSVAQGREYVAAYVQFTHFAEAVGDLTSHGASPKHRENKAEGH